MTNGLQQLQSLPVDGVEFLPAPRLVFDFQGLDFRFPQTEDVASDGEIQDPLPILLLQMPAELLDKGVIVDVFRPLDLNQQVGQIVRRRS